MDIEKLIGNPPFKLDDGDVRALRGQFDDVQPHTWDELQNVIAAGDMGHLRRAPQEQRRYILWLAEIANNHGSSLSFVCSERLHWPQPIVARSALLFAHAEDWKIIWNDWPYHMADGIMHLVLWTKSKIPLDAETGLPTADAAGLIHNLIDYALGKPLGCYMNENILWFKQKAAWQSVKALDHIHIMMRNVQQNQVEKVIGQRRSQALQTPTGIGDERQIASKLS
ncbi:hypothetical protein GCG54_00003811 [Colletotrichum gloeosporioides]|uniref:Uncharacterized protein n=1 Tax=Colletotrichum gloeosporioides TaxID=474922 RepID=A0A8H4CE50_COLGL|nr:uncharacterized protein GCG54_00003811 [Colletotrichum gloeosporioides]KAF3802350.1 hypothetical protein GCG54_00003811 [Colletotrichum gloeosporioides]